MLFAQDIIVKKDGEEIPCKVMELDPPKIKYRPTNHTDGPIRNLYYKDVFMIKYGNGTKDVLEESTANEASTSSNKTTTTTTITKPEQLYNIRPWSLGFHGTVLGTYQAFGGLKGSLSYTFSPIPIRLQIDGGVAASLEGGFSPLLMANFCAQYVFSLKQGTIELSPEIGAGGFYQSFTGTYVMVLLGAVADFRLKEWLNLRLNTRYRGSLNGNVGGFEGSVGVCFLFGKHNK